MRKWEGMSEKNEIRRVHMVAKVETQKRHALIMSWTDSPHKVTVVPNSQIQLTTLLFCHPLANISFPRAIFVISPLPHFYSHFPTLLLDLLVINMSCVSTTSYNFSSFYFITYTLYLYTCQDFSKFMSKF